MIPLRPRRRHHSHLRPDPVPVRSRALQLHRQPVIPRPRNISQHDRRFAQRRQRHIHAPVSVEVRECRSAMHRRSADLRCPKLAVRSLEQQQVRLPRLPARIHLGVVLHVPARGEQVLPAVVVEVIRPRAPAAQRDRRRPDPRRIRDVREHALPEIPVQRKRLVRQRRHE